MTTNTPYVLGINGCQDTFHDASATLLRDGVMRCSVEEERFNRIKHSRGVPRLAVHRALREEGISASDVTAVGFYLDPWLMFRHYFLNTVRDFFPDSFDLFQALPFYVSLLRTPELLRRSLGLSDGTPVYFVRHHLCHAAAAFYGSDFDRAAILIVDGSGERETSSYYLGEGRSIRPLASPMCYPTSIGFLYEGIASHLGLGWVGGAGKMMGLAPFGKPTKYKVLRSWFNFEDDGSITIDLRKMGYYLNHSFFSPSALEEIGRGRAPNDPIEQDHADLAASAQLILEDVVVHLGRCLRKRTNADALCYAGGVALNIDANTALLERAGFRNVYIMPAAYDGGTSIGAAYAAHFRAFPSARRPAPIWRADQGFEYKDEEYLSALEGADLAYERIEDAQLLEIVAECLARNRVVGWFRGRMEFGPRALGFRSILADPRSRRMSDYVNLQVKGRELFRPFAPAVPLEEADRFFEILAPSPFMLYKFNVRPEMRERLAGITHVDGSARVQTVTEQENSLFHRLLLRFGQITGVPVLLNTSFNLAGEPLVETPEQAVASFQRSGMDLLVLGNYVVRRDGAPRFNDFAGRSPEPAGVIWSGRGHSESREKAEPYRFDLPPSLVETWLQRSAHRSSAADFYSTYYRKSLLSLINKAASWANAADRRVIAEIP